MRVAVMIREAPKAATPNVTAIHPGTRVNSTEPYMYRLRHNIDVEVVFKRRILLADKLKKYVD